jgi:hypothetical protein
MEADLLRSLGLGVRRGYVRFGTLMADIFHYPRFGQVLRLS